MMSPWRIRSIWFCLLVLLSTQLCWTAEGKGVKRASRFAVSPRRVRQTHKNLTPAPVEDEVPLDEVQEGFKIEPSNAVQKKTLQSLFAELGPEFEKGWMNENGKFYKPEKKGLLFFILRTPMRKKLAFCQGYLSAMEYMHDKKYSKETPESGGSDYVGPAESDGDISSVFGNGFFEAGSNEDDESATPSNNSESSGSDGESTGSGGDYESNSSEDDKQGPFNQIPQYPPNNNMPPLNTGDPAYPYAPYPYPNQYPYPYPNNQYPGQNPPQYPPIPYNPQNQYPPYEPYNYNNVESPWNNGYGPDPSQLQQYSNGYWMNSGNMYRAFTRKYSSGRHGDGEEVFPVSLEEYCENLIAVY